MLPSFSASSGNRVSFATRARPRLERRSRAVSRLQRCAEFARSADPNSVRRLDRGHPAVLSQLLALLQQPSDGRHGDGPEGASVRRLLPGPGRARRDGNALAAVHRRRDLRAARLPGHLYVREKEGLHHHALHERNADHAEGRRLPRGVAPVLDRDHAVRPDERNLRAADAHPRILREVHPRNRAPEGARSPADSQDRRGDRQQARDLGHEEVRGGRPRAAVQVRSR